MLADLTLVTKVALFRDHRAFEELVHKYQSPVRRFLLNLTHGDEALSDDLAQDTFLKAYQSIGQFKGMASFQTWLMRIAYNAFYDHQRRRRAETVSLDETAPAALLSVKAVKPSIAIDWTLARKQGIHDADFFLADLLSIKAMFRRNTFATGKKRLPTCLVMYKMVWIQL